MDETETDSGQLCEVVNIFLSMMEGCQQVTMHRVVKSNFFPVMYHMCVHFEGNEEVPAELVLGEGGKEDNSAGSCQLSSEMKGEDQLSALS